jgi:ABC-type protease/lipase transport system fused ATPase/permease subunit
MDKLQKDTLKSAVEWLEAYVDCHIDEPSALPKESEIKKNDIDWIPTLLKWWQLFVWMFLSWSTIYYFLDYYHNDKLGVAALFGLLVIMIVAFFKYVTKSLLPPERLSDEEQKAKNKRNTNENTIDSWLSWLEKQGKKKSVEWCTEDEENYKALERLLNEASCYSCTEGSKKLLTWIKSLKERLL